MRLKDPTKSNDIQYLKALENNTLIKNYFITHVIPYVTQDKNSTKNSICYKGIKIYLFNLNLDEF